MSLRDSISKKRTRSRYARFSEANLTEAQRVEALGSVLVTTLDRIKRLKTSKPGPFTSFFMTYEPDDSALRDADAAEQKLFESERMRRFCESLANATQGQEHKALTEEVDVDEKIANLCDAAIEASESQDATKWALDAKLKYRKLKAEIEDTDARIADIEARLLQVHDPERSISKAEEYEMDQIRLLKAKIKAAKGQFDK